jgi:hypothetical protein
MAGKRFQAAVEASGEQGEAEGAGGSSARPGGAGAERFLYRAHGRLTTRMFERTPPRLRWYERVALAVVRAALHRIQAHQMV